MNQSHARLLVPIAAVAVLAACTPGSAGDPVPRQTTATISPTSSPSVPSSPSSVTPLKPTIPGLFRTGINACGNPYGATATTIDTTVPLLDCPGLTGVTPTPSVTVPVGGEITITGIRATSPLTISPSTLLTVHGTSFIAIKPGRTVVTIHHANCLPANNNQPRTSCPILTITAH
jgi:hypothetical protein